MKNTPKTSIAGPWFFDWGEVKGEVHTLGGMLAPVYFRLASGVEVQPFAIAPWVNDESKDLTSIPPILRNLRGEFPCVPFGSDPNYRAQSASENLHPAEYLHGYSANNHWQLNSLDESSIVISIDYPENHSVKTLTRTITKKPGAALQISLQIEMRRSASIALGIHPIFSLPKHPQRAQLYFPIYSSVRSYPQIFEAGRSILLPDQNVDSFTALKTHTGDDIDFSLHPLPVKTEELLMIEGHDGRVELINYETRSKLSMQWDASVYPSCLIWISNKGRTNYPWNGRFTGIGIESVRWDFDAHLSANQNPLASSCSLRPSTFDIETEQVFHTQYCIVMESIII